jgi:glycosyltransferase involved in cell wall biosynthesis
MPRVPVVSVIVPAYNCADTIGVALAAITAQELGEAFEVIVVDDGSEDETPEIVAREAGGVRLVRQSNAGPGPARNRGVEAAEAPILAFTDGDCVPEPSWLRAGLEAMRGADLVQGAVRPDPDAERHPLDRTVNVSAETGLFETANMFVSRHLFDELGGFEDWLGPVIGKPMAEDLWFGWSARRRGARVTFSPEAVVNHAVFQRSLVEFLAEKPRLAYFPRIAVKVPELRRTMFFRRWLFTSRSAAFDLAIVGIAAGAVLGSIVPLIAVAPYARIVVRHTAHWRRKGPIAGLGMVLGDTVGFFALAWGSLRARTLLI